VDDIQVGGRAFLAGVDIGGRFALRSCALHYALDESHVHAIVDAVKDTGARHLAAATPQPVNEKATLSRSPVEVD